MWYTGSPADRGGHPELRVGEHSAKHTTFGGVATHLSSDDDLRFPPEAQPSTV